MDRIIGLVIATSAVALTVAMALPSTREPLFALCLAASRPVPDELMSAWSLAPEVVIPLGALGIAIARWTGGRVSGCRGAALAIGFSLLVLAVVSPLCRLAATLASAHMVQHVILVVLAPAALVLGMAGAGSLGNRAPGSVRSPARLARNPLVAAALYGSAIWLWHMPLLYEAALTSAPVHLLLYASLLSLSLLFWGSILDGIRGDGESAGAAIVALLATAMHTGMLGALLTFAKEPWYPLMAAGGLSWGQSPLDDQRLAGLIMWIPMGAVYLCAALVIVGIVLSRLERPTVGDMARNP